MARVSGRGRHVAGDGQGAAYLAFAVPTHHPSVTTGRTPNATDARPIGDDILDEAFSVSGLLPSLERLVQLNEQLRGEIERLMPTAQGIADRADHGTREWYALDSTLAYTRDVLNEHMPHTPLAASLHVRELARQIYALRKHPVTTPKKLPNDSEKTG